MFDHSASYSTDRELQFNPSVSDVGVETLGAGALFFFTSKLGLSGLSRDFSREEDRQKTGMCFFSLG